jgi:hypothetical protein
MVRLSTPWRKGGFLIRVTEYGPIPAEWRLCDYPWRNIIPAPAK